jgi:hypothetical protein
MCGNHLVVTLVVDDMKLQQYMAPTHRTKTKALSHRAWASPKTEKLEKATCFCGFNFGFTIFNLVLISEVVLVCSAGGEATIKALSKEALIFDRDTQ